MSDSLDPMDYIACQVPLPMGLLQARLWSELPFPSPEDLPDPGIESGSPELQGDSLQSEPLGKPINGLTCFKTFCIPFLPFAAHGGNNENSVCVCVCLCVCMYAHVRTYIGFQGLNIHSVIFCEGHKRQTEHRTKSDYILSLIDYCQAI